MGGLLNGTLWHAAELIIAMIAHRAGRLDMFKPRSLAPIWGIPSSSSVLV